MSQKHTFNLSVEFDITHSNKTTLSDSQLRHITSKLKNFVRNEMNFTVVNETYEQDIFPTNIKIKVDRICGLRM